MLRPRALEFQRSSFTVHDEAGIRERCKSAGAIARLAKPGAQAAPFAAEKRVSRACQTVALSNCKRRMLAPKPLDQSASRGFPKGQFSPTGARFSLRTNRRN
jgi:hypothetical protein